VDYKPDASYADRLIVLSLSSILKFNTQMCCRWSKNAKVIG